MLYIDFLKNSRYNENRKNIRSRKTEQEGDRLENTGHSFISYFKRATSPLLVLHLLRERPMYGYEISAALKTRSGGKFTISILYPVLYRLEDQGFVRISETEVADGRARSYYEITPAGQAHLDKTWEEYRDISAVFEQMMQE